LWPWCTAAARPCPPQERAVVATSWPALRGVIGAALNEQVCVCALACVCVEERGRARAHTQGIATAVLDGSPLELAAAVGRLHRPQGPPSCVCGAGGDGARRAPSPPPPLSSDAARPGPRHRHGLRAGLTLVAANHLFLVDAALSPGAVAQVSRHPPPALALPRPSPHAPPAPLLQLIGRIARQGQAAPACYVYRPRRRALHRGARAAPPRARPRAQSESGAAALSSMERLGAAGAPSSPAQDGGAQ